MAKQRATLAKKANSARAASRKKASRKKASKKKARSKVRSKSPIKKKTKRRAQPSIESLYEGRFLSLVSRGGWEYVERSNASGIVIIVAVTDQNKILLVEQYRRPLDRIVIELPAGLAGDIAGQEGEDLSIAAHRELEEETGYRADSMTFLTEGPPSPGMSTEVITYYRAKGLTRVGPGGGDESEDIKLFEVPLDNVHAWIRRRERKGHLTDPKIFAGLYFALDD